MGWYSYCGIICCFFKYINEYIIFLFNIFKIDYIENFFNLVLNNWCRKQMFFFSKKVLMSLSRCIFSFHKLLNISIFNVWKKLNYHVWIRDWLSLVLWCSRKALQSWTGSLACSWAQNFLCPMQFVWWVYVQQSGAQTLWV